VGLEQLGGALLNHTRIRDGRIGLFAAPLGVRAARAHDGKVAKRHELCACAWALADAFLDRERE
jgi:hypothetical protein